MQFLRDVSSARNADARAIAAQLLFGSPDLMNLSDAEFMQ